MAFITPYDYLTLIREAVKGMVTNDEDSRRATAEEFAIEEMAGYLNYDYDVPRIFDFNVVELASSTNYTPGQLIIDPATGNQYVCIAAGNDTEIGDNTKFVRADGQPSLVYTATGSYTKGNLLIDAQRVSYLCIKNAPAGTALTNKEYFFLRRSALMVMLAIDISVYHYHARINPNQVPQIRIDRYLDAIQKLKMIRKGEMRPAIPRIDTDADGQPNAIGFDMWSNAKRDNSWEPKTNPYSLG